MDCSSQGGSLLAMDTPQEREKMVAVSSSATEVRSDCENPVVKNLANGHPANALEQETPFLKGHLVTGDICANGNKWKRSTIGLSVLLGISITINICLLAKLRQVPAAPRPPDAGPCPKHWIVNEGRCYFFSDAEQNWNASRTDCSSQGGSLPAMDTPQEREFVLDSQRLTYFWLDFWREGVGKPWKRADGSLFNNRFPIAGEGLCSYVNERTPSSTYCDNDRHWICVKPIRGL